MGEGVGGAEKLGALDSLVLSVRGATKEHRDGSNIVRALDNVDLDVFAGEMVAVMGRSGSGKSTLLNVAGGLDEPTSGEVLIEGRTLAGMASKELAAVRRTSVGFVFQNLNLVPSLSACENVSLPLEFDKVRPAEAEEAARTALSRVGIKHLVDRFPDELSGGERQRVAIARAIVGPRRLILADEPTGALDEMTGREVIGLLAELASDGAAVVIVTHEPELAAYADRIIRLRDGKIEQLAVRQATPATAAELLR